MLTLGHVDDAVEVIEDVLEVIDVSQRRAAGGRLAVSPVVQAVDVVASVQQALGHVVIAARVLRNAVCQHNVAAWVFYQLLAVVNLHAFAVVAIEVAVFVGDLLIRNGGATEHVGLICRCFCYWLAAFCKGGSGERSRYCDGRHGYSGCGSQNAQFLPHHVRTPFSGLHHAY